MSELNSRKETLDTPYIHDDDSFIHYLICLVSNIVPMACWSLSPGLSHGVEGLQSFTGHTHHSVLHSYLTLDFAVHLNHCFWTVGGNHLGHANSSKPVSPPGIQTKDYEVAMK